MELCILDRILYFNYRTCSIFIKSSVLFFKEKKAEQNPWGEGATTLEWTVASPPPFHTFEELPRVK